MAHQTMNNNFHRRIERHNTGCMKWDTYDPDVLPMWVADMDFAAPDPVIRALHKRVDHGVFGYSFERSELADVVCERMQRLYDWPVTPEQVVVFPGVVSAINIACRAFGQAGDGVLVQTPVYPPFLSAPGNQDMILQIAELTATHKGRTLEYEIDYEAFEAAITPRTKLFVLSQPHNPTGVDYSPQDLRRMAEICLRHGVLICSDEIHCDLLLGDTIHTPTASLSPEIADRCLTLMAPSKTFNIPGLCCSFAIVTNPELRQRFKRASEGLINHPNVLGLAAAIAAYREGDEWLRELLDYLLGNRDFLVHYLDDCLPQLSTTIPRATYLAWIDCRAAGIEGNPTQFFLDQARVALNDGAKFGTGGEGFVRLNFGCPRSNLVQALERMHLALHLKPELTPGRS